MTSNTFSIREHHNAIYELEGQFVAKLNDGPIISGQEDEWDAALAAIHKEQLGHYMAIDTLYNLSFSGKIDIIPF